MNKLAKPPSNNLRLMLATSYGTAVGALVFNTQPAIVGALADSYGFTGAELGNIIAIVLMAVFFLVVSSFYWVHRVHWRVAVSVGTAAACLGAGSLAFADGFVGVTSSLALVGAGAAGVYVVCLSSLALSSDPTRAFGVAITMQVGVASLTVYLIPTYMLPEYGITGVAMLLLLVNALAFVIVPLLPKGQPRSSSNLESESETKSEPRPGGGSVTLLVMLGLAAMTIYFVGLNGTWAFLERIGVTMSLSGDVIGRALAVSLLFGAIGSLIASVAGRRVSINAALWLSGGGFLIFVYLILEVPGATSFTMALLVFNVAWNFSLPYQMDLISRTDAHGRYIVLVPAAQTIGGAVGPAIAGPMLVSTGVSGIYIQLAVCIGIAFLLYGFMANRVRYHFVGDAAADLAR